MQTSSKRTMPTYKGNRGNLLQHWVLAELIAVLERVVSGQRSLCFVDAHAMSPYAVRHPNPGQTAADFDRVARHLPGGASRFESAWHELSSDSSCRYPSSGAFVRRLWQGPLHLVLCEHDSATADEVSRWIARLGSGTSCELHRGDWRLRFRSPLPRDYDAYAVSFDPYMLDRHGPPRTPDLGNMWLCDVVRAAAALLDLPKAPTVVQLSTYSANNANAQVDVIDTVAPILAACEFRLEAAVRADGNMMSMVFARGVPEVRDAGLPERFTTWLDRVRASEPG